MPDVVAVSPVVSADEEVIFGRESASTQVEAGYPDLLAVGGYSIARGAFFTQADQDAARPVAVLGATVARELFGPSVADPLGSRVRIGVSEFQVIGVLGAKGHSAQGDLDDVVLVPLSAGELRVFGQASVASILVQADEQSSIPTVIARTTAVLREQHRLRASQPNDFRVGSYRQVVEAARRGGLALNAMLSAVAAVALLLGGFGVMNVTLVAVAERTREIGVRMAVGATPRDVLGQFVAEAAVLACLGGALGVAVGFPVATLVPHLIGALATYPTGPALEAIPLGLGVSLLTGTVFGVYPAWRGSRLDPIAALRDL